MGDHEGNNAASPTLMPSGALNEHSPCRGRLVAIAVPFERPAIDRSHCSRPRGSSSNNFKTTSPAADRASSHVPQLRLNAQGQWRAGALCSPLQTLCSVSARACASSKGAFEPGSQSHTLAKGTRRARTGIGNQQVGHRPRSSRGPQNRYARSERVPTIMSV